MGRARLLESKNWIDIYILGRFWYAQGKPIIGDKAYDKIDKALTKLKEEGKTEEWLDRYLTGHYEDDPFPEELLKKYGFNIEEASGLYYRGKEQVKEYGEYEELLESEISKSITPVESYSEALAWIKGVRKGETLVASLKIDGINTKNLYKGGKYCVSATRGRGGTPFDITKNAGRIVPNRIGDKGTVFVRGEAVMTREGLAELNKAGYDFKTCRSSAMSLLRKDIESKWYRYLKLIAFKKSGENTLTEGLEELKRDGFDVVPYRVVKRPNTDDNEELIKWMDKIMEELWEEGRRLGLASDGVVIEIDNQAIFNSQGEDEKYNYGNIALKIGRWKPGYYTGTVKDIIIEQQKSKCSVVIEVEPVLLENGITVKRVNGFNLDIIIKNGIKPGEEIYFEFKSESSINLIYERE